MIYGTLNVDFDMALLHIYVSIMKILVNLEVSSMQMTCMTITIQTI